MLDHPTLDQAFRALLSDHPLKTSLTPIWAAMKHAQWEKACEGAKGAYLATSAAQTKRAVCLLEKAFGEHAPQALACALGERLSTAGMRKATGQWASAAKEAACLGVLARGAASASPQSRALCLAEALGGGDWGDVAALEALGFGDGIDASAQSPAVQFIFLEACRNLLMRICMAQDQNHDEGLKAFGRFGGAKILGAPAPLRIALTCQAPQWTFQCLIAAGADPFSIGKLESRPFIDDMLASPALKAYATALIQERELRKATPIRASRSKPGL